MTVREAKQTIVDALEQLQRDGVWVRSIDVSWETEVGGKDKAVLDAAVKCKITFGADL